MENNQPKIHNPIQSLDSFISLMVFMDMWKANHPEYTTTFLVGENSYSIQISK